ncbi:Lipid transport protein N-terminal, partial [Trinorchestia longiramus]
MDEVGIVGECEARYELEEASEDTYVINRSSNECSNIPVSSTTSLPLAIQRVPLVSSSFESKQTVVAGIIQKVESHYQLELKAVSGGAGGAINYGKSTLELVNVAPSELIPEFPMAKSSLMYDDSPDEETIEGHIRSVETTLSALDQASLSLVKPEMPELFSQLVENLRHLNQRQMSIVYEANRNSPVWKYLVDAAPLVATPASMLIVKDLILSDQMADQETRAWFTSLAFIPKPTIEMFQPLPVSL